MLLKVPVNRSVRVFAETPGTNVGVGVPVDESRYNL
jgi:hypothetical protein